MSLKSSNNGCMYISNSLPFIVVGTNISTNCSTKNHLVVTHGRKLYTNANTSHVLHLHNFVAKGSKPSMDKPMTMSFALRPNSPIVVVKCFHAFEYVICLTRSSALLCMACHFSSATMFGDLNHLTRCEIRGNYHITFTSSHILPCLLYWPSPHSG